ncbi:uncharacterized protein LOC110191946 isoform X1 [Drosophila serrata]|uniref:uncharacterized protein LOC110191946 isoform X1 n=1 Tax=Drosophila serrata TaxID=7274 RepID=UPI000A1D06C5|nr:uncharacterized protein LOC110191946 isoform X1 [Drosophila serrata]
MTDVKIKVNLFLFYIYGWEKMCKNCSDLTIRLECIIWSIAEIVFSVAFIGFICGRHEVHNIILLAALSLGILAGFCLLLGAILRKRFLVLTWIVLICPTIVIVISMSCLILKENWNFLPGFDKARKIIALIIIVCWIIYMVYLSCLFIREIKTGERQKRYPDCVGGHYPRGALRERTRSNLQDNSAIAVKL